MCIGLSPSGQISNLRDKYYNYLSKAEVQIWVGEKDCLCLYSLNNQRHIPQKKHSYPGHEMLPLGCVSFLMAAICYNGKSISDASGSIWQGTTRFSITWSLQSDSCCSSCFFLQKLQCTEKCKVTEAASSPSIYSKLNIKQKSQHRIGCL